MPMASVRRVVTGFVVAPFVATVSVVVTASLAERSLPLPGFLLATTVVAFGVAFVVGVPIFLMTRSFAPRSLLAHLLLGGLIGALPGTLLWFLVGSPTLSASAIVGAMAATAAFWLITVWASNNKLQRTRGVASESANG
jgi:hypothetical protein